MNTVQIANNITRKPEQIMPSDTKIIDAIQASDMFDGDERGWMINGRPVFDLEMTIGDFVPDGKKAFISKIVKADCAYEA